MDKITKLHTFFDQVTSAGVGNTMYISTADEVVILIATDGSGTADFDLDFQVSAGTLSKNTASDYSSPATRNNLWVNCTALDIGTDTSLTSVSSAGGDVYKILKLDIPKNITYLNVKLNSIAAGDVSVWGQAYFDNVE